MYIDKIYTKLYSERDWNGLSQLVNEIKSFARTDYDGLSQDEILALKAKRDEVAKKFKERRSQRNDVRNLISDEKLKDLENRDLIELSRLNRDTVNDARRDHNTKLWNESSKITGYDKYENMGNTERFLRDLWDTITLGKGGRRESNLWKRTMDIYKPRRLKFK